MVRILVGTLVEVAQGKRPASDLPKLLRGEDDVMCGPTAPAHGLCLQEVWY
jgi:tRNA pseudouridine38-40 synthase